MKDVKRLKELLVEGKCCAVALVQVALESVGEKNDRLLQAVSGLCGGVQSGLVCGALTGAACMLNVLDPKNANAHMIPDLADWFVEKVKEEYGGVQCNDILGGDPARRTTRCPELIVATYLMAKEIMKPYGHEPEQP